MLPLNAPILMNHLCAIDPNDHLSDPTTQARAKAAEGKATGKLGSQLQQQKKQTMNETMKQAAGEEARRREIETANAQRNYE